MSIKWNKTLAKYYEIAERFKLVSIFYQFKYILLRGEFTSQTFLWNDRDI